MIKYNCDECGKEYQYQAYQGSWNSMQLPLKTFCSEECLNKSVEKCKENSNDN